MEGNGFWSQAMLSKVSDSMDSGQKVSHYLLLQCWDSNQNPILLLDDVSSKERGQRWMKSCQQSAAGIFVFHLGLGVATAFFWVPAGLSNWKSMWERQEGDRNGRLRRKERWGAKDSLHQPKGRGKKSKETRPVWVKDTAKWKKKKSPHQIRAFFPEQIPQINHPKLKHKVLIRCFFVLPRCFSVPVEAKD